MNATSEWRAMATAPKNGNEILIVLPGGHSDHYHVMYWDGEEAWLSRYHDDYRITEAALAECHLMPMWAEIHDPPSSLCAGPGIVNVKGAA